MRLASRLRAQLGRIQDQRLDLLPELPAAHLPAREAVRRAERALRELTDAADEPDHPGSDASRPRRFERLRRRLAIGRGPAAASDAVPTAAARAGRREAHQRAARALQRAQDALTRIEVAHDRHVAATEAERSARLSRLARRAARLEAALHLLADADDWAGQGLRVLMRAAMRAPQAPRHDDGAIAEVGLAPESTGAPGLR